MVAEPGDDSASQYWRGLAQSRDRELRQLKRRPVLRAALAVDRRLDPIRRRGAAAATAWRRLVGRFGLVFAALPRLAQRPRRRARLQAELARLGPPPPASEVEVIRADAATSYESSLATLDRVARTTSSRLVCFVTGPVDVLDDLWLDRLAAVIDGDIVAATPTLVHPARAARSATPLDLLVRTEGVDVDTDADGEPHALGRHAGGLPHVDDEVSDVDGAPLQGLVVDRAAFVEAGGMRTFGDDDSAALDLCARLRARGGRIVHVPSAVLGDARPVRSREALLHPVDERGPGWRAFIEQHGVAAIAPTRRNARPSARWVITTAVPSAKVAERWGDWHFAVAFATALRRAGHDVVVQTHDRADSLAARGRDVHVVLRGLAPVRRTPGQRHVLWVVSHPESLDPAECDEADLVLVASERFADHLRARTSTPVDVVLQATDTHRFRPGPPDPTLQYPVLVVAKSRGVMRSIVEDALAAGIRPAIYGGGWHGLVDPDLLVADHLDNERLPDLYRSAGVVLNDHWGTMREWGFVSNRIFDVLACGSPVISDHLPEVRDLFGDAVPTYRSVDDLAALVQSALGDRAAAVARAESGRRAVLAHHTFDHRACQIRALLERYGMLSGEG